MPFSVSGVRAASLVGDVSLLCGAGSSPRKVRPRRQRLRSRALDHRPVVFGLPIRATTHHPGHTEGVNAMNVFTFVGSQFHILRCRR